MARTFKEMLKTRELVNVFALGRIPNPIIVEIASIFPTSGVGFIFINLTVSILVLIAIIE